MQQRQSDRLQASRAARVEITYLDAHNHPVNRGEAVAVRRRIIAEDGSILSDRTKTRHKHS